MAVCIWYKFSFFDTWVLCIKVQLSENKFTQHHSSFFFLYQPIMMKSSLTCDRRQRILKSLKKISIKLLLTSGKYCQGKQNTECYGESRSLKRWERKGGRERERERKAGFSDLGYTKMHTFALSKFLFFYFI